MNTYSTSSRYIPITLGSTIKLVHYVLLYVYVNRYMLSYILTGNFHAKNLSYFQHFDYLYIQHPLYCD